MFIHAYRARRFPRWYLRHVTRRVYALAEANPGFHRLVVFIDGAGANEVPLLVNPNIEPEVRRLLSRVLVLSEPVEDDEAWARL